MAARMAAELLCICSKSPVGLLSIASSLIAVAVSVRFKKSGWHLRKVAKLGSGTFPSKILYLQLTCLQGSYGMQCGVSGCHVTQHCT